MNTPLSAIVSWTDRQTSVRQKQQPHIQHMDYKHNAPPPKKGFVLSPCVSLYMTLYMNVFSVFETSYCETTLYSIKFLFLFLSELRN